jgi:hypothetical protein
MFDDQCVLLEPLVRNILQVGINSLCEFFFCFSNLLVQFSSILLLQGLSYFSNLGLKRGLKNDFGLLSEFLREFFAAKKCIDIFFDIYFFCFFLLSNYLFGRSLFAPLVTTSLTPLRVPPGVFSFAESSSGL